MKPIILIFGLLIVVFQAVNANQQRVVTGTVRDENNSPLSGVSVVTDHKKSNATTNSLGKYEIKIQPGDKELVFLFAGMKTLKKKIGSQAVIDVVMEPEQIVRLYDSAVMFESKKLNGYGKMETPSMCNAFIVRMQREDWNTENYSTIHENGFKNAKNNPLSTFSIDVDKASYSNVRRYIDQGIKPPTDAVKVEEMINYFTYDYPEPVGEHPFSLTTELGNCPWNKNHYLLHIGLKGKNIDKSKLPPSNLVFLIDVSGSMQTPNKLPLLKKAFTLLVNELRPQDRVAIVVYAGAAGKVLDPTPGNKKDKILDAIANLQAGGSTAGGEGLKLAYKTARENFIEDGNNRIILATDGDFNVGVSSTSEMERLVEKERNSGIYITVLGFGMGNIKDDKMETIADKGNGNYSYIDDIEEARKVFITEFGGTLFTIAKDVKFQLEFNPANVKSYRLVGYENRLLNDEDFNDDKKDAGEMGSGHTVTALYEIIPASSGEAPPSVDPLRYQEKETAETKFGDELLNIKVRYKDPNSDTSRKLEVMVAPKPKENTSANFRFSAAVASFGMLLRDSEYKGNATFSTVIELAKSAKGDDDEGYRAEFINMVRNAEKMGISEK